MSKRRTYSKEFKLYEVLRGVIFTFIEIWYNRQRLHSTLDYRTPVEMQDHLTQQQEQAA